MMHAVCSRGEEIISPYSWNIIMAKILENNFEIESRQTHNGVTDATQNSMDFTSLWV